MSKRYKKSNLLTYAIGVSPVIECLNFRSSNIEKIVLSPKGDKNTGIKKIKEKCKELNIPIETNQRTVGKISLSENTYAVAIIRKYKTTLNKNANHVVLLNPSDMGNLGTICRTMLGLNFIDLAIITPSVDVFDPKVLRASMGSVFSLNIEMFKSLEDYTERFKHNIYLFMGDGNLKLEETKFKQLYSLVFGNEGSGIDNKYKKMGETIRLTQNNKVDSYNLSVAVGIALYEVNIKSL